MAMTEKLGFTSVHIDVARNATDDFNPFHDKTRWQRISGNPFGEPIVLGFQLESLIAHTVRQFREQAGEDAVMDSLGLRYSNFDFRYVSAVTAGTEITLDIKPSRLKDSDNPSLSNRISLKSNGKLAVTGYKRETNRPLFLPDIDLAELGKLDTAQDRCFLNGSNIFLKRKYMTTSNAKNFLCGSLVEQADYIDELVEKVDFPEMFPCALLSCALLERAWSQGHDFEQQPMVYTSHQISVDRAQLATLRSNDSLHLLSRPSADSDNPHCYDCVGIIGNDRLLFGAQIELMPL